MGIQRQVKSRTQHGAEASVQKRADVQRRDTLVDALKDPLEADSVQAKDEVQRQPIEEEEEELMAKGEVQRQPIEEEEEELMAKGEVQRQPIEEEEEELMAKGEVQRQPIEEEEEELMAKGSLQRQDGNQTAAVHRTASEGLSGSGGQMPHADKIQASFGDNDVSGVQAHTGSASKAANEQLGSQAYAKGEQVAFKGTPDLHTAAHEAAHVVQQRQGVNLTGGVGKAGDSYERNADAVADAVVQGRSAEGLLPGGSKNKKK